MKHRKSIAIVLSTALAWAGFASTAGAAVIGTGDALAIEQRQAGAPLRAVQAGLARNDVRQAMIQLGVDPVEAQLRVAALGDAELAQLHQRIEQLPAGGILGLIGAVFVVLLILELTGVIDIFKKT
jgi:hypothetical protein